MEVVSKGIFEDEYIWAQSNPDHPLGKQLLQLAQLYARSADRITYSLIESVCKDIRKNEAFNIKPPL